MDDVIDLVPRLQGAKDHSERLRRRKPPAPFCAHYRMEIDLQNRKLTCKDCKAEVDPYQALNEIAHDGDWVVTLREERETLGKAIVDLKSEILSLKNERRRLAGEVGIPSDAEMQLAREDDCVRRSQEFWSSRLEQLRATLPDDVYSILLQVHGAGASIYREEDGSWRVSGESAAIFSSGLAAAGFRRSRRRKFPEWNWCPSGTKEAVSSNATP